jgi:hypothetical protein
LAAPEFKDSSIVNYNSSLYSFTFLKASSATVALCLIFSAKSEYEPKASLSRCDN